jgi:hypothetical protein
MRIALFLFNLIIPGDFPYREELLGDLLEELAEKQSELGPTGARRWLWGQVLRSSPPFLRWRLERAFVRGVVRVIHISLLVYLLPAIVATLLMLVAAIVICRLIDAVRMRGTAARVEIADEGREALVLCLVLGTLQATRDGLWPLEAWSWTLGRPEFWGPLGRVGIPAEVLAVFPRVNELVALERSVDRITIDAELDRQLSVVRARLADPSVRLRHIRWS